MEDRRELTRIEIVTPHHTYDVAVTASNTTGIVYGGIAGREFSANTVDALIDQIHEYVNELEHATAQMELTVSIARDRNALVSVGVEQVIRNGSGRVLSRRAVETPTGGVGVVSGSLQQPIAESRHVVRIDGAGEAALAAAQDLRAIEVHLAGKLAAVQAEVAMLDRELAGMPLDSARVSDRVSVNTYRATVARLKRTIGGASRSTRRNGTARA